MVRALVIDDELDICMMVTKHLQNARFETDYARTVKDAFAKLTASKYELVMLDLNLPDGTGYDVMSFLKESESQPSIIVISAYDNEVSDIMDKGASLFIAKPFTTRTVSKALKALNFLPE